MTDLLTQVGFWSVVLMISFGVISYYVLTSPEYEEMEDGSMIRTK
jgi:hypothetical protein